MADLFMAGRDWSTLNVDHAVGTQAIDQVNEVLVRCGTRQAPVQLPFATAGVIKTWETCLAASLLANETQAMVGGLDTVGHLPQDALAQVEANLRAIVAGANSIPHSTPRIMPAQGNLRSSKRGSTQVCHAIVIAFSIEQCGL